MPFQTPNCKEAEKKHFDESGYITIELGHIRYALHRIYLTVFFLLKPRWLRRATFYRRKAAAKSCNRTQQENLKIAYHLSNSLPPQTLAILQDQLGVKRFGETAKFDHLDFAYWMNEKPNNLSADWASYFYDKHAHLFSVAQTPRTITALERWLEDLTLLAELLTAIKEEFTALTDHHNIRIEHAHLKSWQARKGYKAQWWHMDRGIISAIATIQGPGTTEFLLQDPAPYPLVKPGFDAFVFPAEQIQIIYHAREEDLIICGGRQRKEQGKSYLWHRAPIASNERLVLVIKTHRN